MCLSTTSTPTIAQEDITAFKFISYIPATKSYRSLYTDHEFTFRKNKKIKKVELGITTRMGKAGFLANEGYHAYAGSNLECVVEGSYGGCVLKIKIKDEYTLDCMFRHTLNNTIIRQIWKVVIPKGTKIVWDKHQCHIVAETMKYVEQMA